MQVDKLKKERCLCEERQRRSNLKIRIASRHASLAAKGSFARNDTFSTVSNYENNKCLKLILTGFSCNNNCIHCSFGMARYNMPDKMGSEVKEILCKGIREGFVKVEFTGGEPSIRKDFLSLIKYARDIGYQHIGVSSNGRLFSYQRFLNNAIENGLKQFTISLHSHNQKKHDATTRTPGSYAQTIKGIKNILKSNDVKLVVATVVSHLNYKELHGLGAFLKHLGLKMWYLLDLIPSGFAERFYDTLHVPANELSDALNQTIKTYHRDIQIELTDFSPCLIQNDLIIKNKVKIIFADRKKQIKQTGYGSKRISKINNLYFDIHKKRFLTCDLCFYKRICTGVWKNTLALHGSSDYDKLSQQNKCLR